MTQVERRKYVRLKTQNFLKHQRFSFLGSELTPAPQAPSKDLSAGGLLFESLSPYAVGDLLRMDLLIPGWEKYKTEFYKGITPSTTEPVVVLAKVVRVEILGSGVYDIGVQFVGIDEGHQMALVKYIREHLK